MIVSGNKAKKFSTKCLNPAEIVVLNTKNKIIVFQLTNNKSLADDNITLNTQQSIFPSTLRLRNIFEFIEINYYQNISLKEVAQAVGYSSAYLTDLVRRHTGKTVNRWIIERRLVQAGTLLVETNYSVKVIASKVGYRNINHFYCQFRDYYEHTPRSWRDLQRCKLV